MLGDFVITTVRHENEEPTKVDGFQVYNTFVIYMYDMWNMVYSRTLSSLDMWNMVYSRIQYFPHTICGIRYTVEYFPRTICGIWYTVEYRAGIHKQKLNPGILESLDFS